ncbi:serine hydrolase domain-containing protein [Propionibacteriaceae bacterium Y1700]|uniref:serine hydrolase domain-containing protein n=1 Tax=Microlunatus sp. Y1700 TaxID=3418487 RepID=UPI003DA71981
MIQDYTARLLNHALATAQRDDRLPSIAAGLVRDGALVWSQAYGTVDGRADGVPADADTQYRIGSITKTLTGVLIMRLRDAGKLALTDRFDDHVPGTEWGDVTIAQLLSHTGGVQSETHGPWWERTPGTSWEELAATATQQRFRAGRHYHYSNLGYGALGEVVARLTDRSWADAVREELLLPLEMTRTTARPEGKAAHGLAVHPFADLLLDEPEHDHVSMAPAGQLWSTVSDLARWAAFLAGDTGELLSADTLAEMLEPQAIQDLPGQPWTSAHGLGFQVFNFDGRRMAGHGGSMPGFLANLRVDTTSGDGVVLFANTTAGLNFTAHSLIDLLAEHEPKLPEPWHASAPEPAALELVGTWHWGPSVTTASVKDGHLVLGAPGAGRGSRFRPDGEDRWIGLDGYHTGEPLQVIRRADGSVSHLDLASFRFTRTPYDPEADLPGGPGEWR